MKKTIISILTLSMVSITILCINNNNYDVSALTYSDNIGVNFTFSSSLSVSLSSSDIIINDLTPGSSSDSNIITVNVLSNNANGYALNSTVGNSTHTNPSYDTRNLVHSNTSSSSNSNAIFSSLDYTTTPTIATPSDFNDNEWGYSYSLDNSTWSNYSGLPKYDDTTNITTLRTSTGPSASTGDNTYFKIAAKASTTQASGEYNNVINFTVVGTANPTSFYDAFSSAGKSMYNGYYRMQDMDTSICNSVYTSQLADNTDTMEAQLIDIRDNNVYWVAKLKDEHCWMTQGLDLDLQHDNILTHETSDIGWTENNATKIWNPASTANTINFTGTAIPGWNNDNDTPYSASPHGEAMTDNIYVISSSNSEADSIYNSLRDCSANTDMAEIECSHYRVGNYYNFAAANASNSLPEDLGHTISGTDNHTIMPDSICPANWRMPQGLLTDSAGGSNNSNFDNLLYAYSITPKNNAIRDENVGFTSNGSIIVRINPLYFIRSGSISGMANGSWGGRGEGGYSWSSTISSALGGYSLDFNASYMSPAHSSYRLAGIPVRCLAR